MSQNGHKQTAADYVVIALSPALLIALICSLVYFLLEVFYQGEFQGRMRWILFFYVFGCVLVARVAMQTEIAARAPLYSLIMAVGTWVGLGMFVEYPPDMLTVSWIINLGLVGLVWWSAQKLTWDCTFIDDKVDAGTRGLLQETGLEKGSEPEPPPESEADDKLNWWERFVRFRDAQRKKHTPGAWVIYFSLVALPLFGLGQSLIPPDETARRRYTFLLMVIYVASGLGLLLTTCFLGLRRYLRQRNLRMPAAMTGTWLSMGGFLIAVLIVVGAIIPRPSSETPWLDLGPLGSKKRQASRMSAMRDGSGKDKGQPGDAGKQKDGPAQQKDGNPRGKDGEGKKGSDGNSQKSSNPGQKGDSKGNQQGKSDSGEKGEHQGKGRDNESKGKQDEDRGGGRSGDQDRKDDGKKEEKSQDQSSGSSSPKSFKTFFQHVPEMGGLAAVLKWIVFAIVAGLIVFNLLRSGLKWLANFSQWARNLLDALRNFWASLFGKADTEEGKETAGEEEAPLVRPPRPFAAFHNPFEDGRADRLPPDEIVRYTFTAFQSWAFERDLARQADETALEFAARVGNEVPGLDADARRLAGLYAQAVYARGSIPASSLAAVRQFWDKLEAVTEQPLSA